MQFFIKENFYFDIDNQNQLRIAGPQNHLMLGLAFPYDLPVEVLEFEVTSGQLTLNLQLPASNLVLSSPIVTDVRTLRNLTEPLFPRPTFGQLLEEYPNFVKPREFKIYVRKNVRVIRCLNSYQDEQGRNRIYGTEILIPAEFKVSSIDSKLQIQGDKNIRLSIRTLTNVRIKEKIRKPIFQESAPLPANLFSQQLLDIYDESKLQIEHLVKTQKTSSFEYGTIFPRDWIESSDLGENDLSPEAVDYMYARSMTLVSEEGEGWHENIVGEFKTKISDKNLEIDRRMIDIEPRYLMGVKKVSKKLFSAADFQKKVRSVAKYLISKASEQDLISFKKKQNSDDFERIGNWRDSHLAYPRQKTPLAPYDVNCVFYPVSLRVIREYHEYLQIENAETLDKLIEKWDQQKMKFRLYHPDQIIGYSLALHGNKHLPLPIAHLDECYDLFYGEPSLEEIASFAQKIVSPNYFFTPVGPLLVAVDEEEFTTYHYHGKVIWPKQAAFSVAGLARQYYRGKTNLWPAAVLELVKHAIIETSRACFRAWEQMGFVPELYYYDSLSDKARLYIDQEKFEGQMSAIQLWSAVGVRRIMKDYAAIMETGD